MTSYKKNVKKENELLFSRSNLLIDSKHNCTLLENKLISYGLATVQVDENNIPYADINIRALKEFKGIEPTNIYKRVKKLSKTITKHTVLVEDKDIITGKKRFMRFNLVNYVKYVEGEATFRIKFGREILPLIKELKAPYTTSRVRTLMSFKTNYCYRLYEILSKKEYLLYPKDNREQAPKYVIDRHENLNDLRMQLTLVNIDDEKAGYVLEKPYNELNESEKALYESILQKSLYKDWSAMKQFVIDPSRKQMNANPLCPIAFDYKTIRTGRGGRVTGIEFIIYRNENYIFNNQKLLLTEKDKIEVPENKNKYIQEVRKFVVYENISDIDIIKMLDVANYDIDRIRAAYKLSLEQEVIYNFVGWMLEAIKGNWADNGVAIMKSRTEKESKDLLSLYDEYVEERDDSYVHNENYDQYTLDLEEPKDLPEQSPVEEQTTAPEQDPADKTNTEKKSSSIDLRFIELFTKCSEKTITEEEDAELKQLLKLIAEEKLNSK